MYQAEFNLFYFNFVLEKFFKNWI